MKSTLHAASLCHSINARVQVGIDNIISKTNCKKLILLVFGLFCAYLTFSQDTCSVKPDFIYRQDTSNCKRIYFFNYSQPINSNVKFTWKFGDGATSNEVNPTHDYNVKGNYQVCLKIDSGANCVKEICKTVQVLCDTCALSVDYIFQPEPSQPNRVYFQSQVTYPPGSIPLYTWDFGDGSPTTYVGNPTHDYASPGVYNACLKVYINSTCFKVACKTIIIGPVDSCNLQVKWRFEKDPANPKKVKFINETIVPAAGAQYLWTFGDGTSSNDKDPVHLYQNSGQYKVCLLVRISNTCARESCSVINIDSSACRVEAKFDFRIDSLQRNKVYFQNHTATNADSVYYVWKFGDGTTSHDVNPTHIYQQPGIYEVCLVAETKNGCRSVYCKKIEVGPILNCPVEPKFEWKIDEGNPRKVHFKSIPALPSPLVRYHWNFGDGTTSNDKNPVHVYEKPGEYEVCLTVSVINLCSKSTCKKIVIKEDDCNVKAKFEWKQDGQKWQKVWFSNLSHPVPQIWRTHWTYGDGTSSQDFNSFHEYPNAGKYYVCLKVISLNGCIDTYCDSVIVRPKDTCENRSNFKWEPIGNNDLQIKFKPEHINTTWKYYWKFGDGNVSVAVTPIHKFERPGTYNVCLTVVQKNGCITTTCKEVKVGASCENAIVKFEYKRDEKRPNKIHFKSVSNQHIVKQKWVIKKDSTVGGFPYVVVLTQNNPTFIFPFAGWYTVCLEATLANGCVKQYCERINIERVVFLNVVEPPLIISPNPTRTTARLDLKLENAAAVSVNVMDEAGALKYQLQVSGRSGNNTIYLPVEKLSQGQYLVQLRYGNQVRWARFQKM